MKTMGLCFAAVAALLTGCAFHHAPSVDLSSNDSLVNTKMNQSLSSDAAGVEDDNNTPPPSGAMPVTMTIDQLPPVAQAAIRREAGQKRVLKIRREDHDGQIVYRVKLTRDGGLFHGLLEVTPDGAVVRTAHLSEPASADTTH